MIESWGIVARGWMSCSDHECLAPDLFRSFLCVHFQKVCEKNTGTKNWFAETLSYFLWNPLPHLHSLHATCQSIISFSFLIIVWTSNRNSRINLVVAPCKKCTFQYISEQRLQVTPTPIAMIKRRSLKYPDQASEEAAVNFMRLPKHLLKKDQSCILLKAAISMQLNWEPTHLMIQRDLLAPTNIDLCP